MTARKRGRDGIEKSTVDFLDAIHPCIASFGQLTLSKSVPGRFFPLINSTGSNLDGIAARRANSRDGVSQRPDNGCPGRNTAPWTAGSNHP